MDNLESMVTREHSFIDSFNKYVLTPYHVLGLQLIKVNTTSPWSFIPSELGDRC